MLPHVKAHYRARATDAPISFGTASTGNMQVSVEFQIEDHPEFTGDSIAWIGTFSDNSSERTVESLQIAGWQGDDIAELAGVPANQVLGDQVSLACDVDTYTDKDGITKESLKVQWVNRTSSRFAFKQEADPSALRALGARLRSTAQSLRGGQRTQKPAAADKAVDRSRGGGGSGGGGYGGGGGPARHPNAPGGDDDIPF